MILLSRPKYVTNLAAVVRAAACWGVTQVRYDGDRIIDPDARIPRELRMYRSVDLQRVERLLPVEKGFTPVAVELMDSAEDIVTFEHPERAVYVFGPEDGSLHKEILRHCHRFVRIPSRVCLNLAAAVNVVLYDRQLKTTRQEDRDGTR